MCPLTCVYTQFTLWVTSQCIETSYHKASTSPSSQTGRKQVARGGKWVEPQPNTPISTVKPVWKGRQIAPRKGLAQLSSKRNKQELHCDLTVWASLPTWDPGYPAYVLCCPCSHSFTDIVAQPSFDFAISGILHVLPLHLLVVGQTYPMSQFSPCSAPGSYSFSQLGQNLLRIFRIRPYSKV